MPYVIVSYIHTLASEGAKETLPSLQFGCTM